LRTPPRREGMILDCAMCEGCYDTRTNGDPIRLTKGVHTRDIRSSLTSGRTNRVFAALEGPPLRVLEKYPLDVLELGHSLPSGWDGGYFPSEGRITVRPSVPREHSSGTWYTRLDIYSWITSRGR
jgi:hypothetical protein